MHGMACTTSIKVGMGGARYARNAAIKIPVRLMLSFEVAISNAHASKRSKKNLIAISKETQAAKTQTQNKIGMNRKYNSKTAHRPTRK